jgi:hypothetical protein
LPNQQRMASRRTSFLPNHAAQRLKKRTERRRALASRASGKSHKKRGGETFANCRAVFMGQHKRNGPSLVAVAGAASTGMEGPDTFDLGLRSADLPLNSGLDRCLFGHSPKEAAPASRGDWGRKFMCPDVTQDTSPQQRVIATCSRNFSSRFVHVQFAETACFDPYLV